MKQKISITIDESLSEHIDKALEEGKFRNRSHILEYSLRKFLNDGGKE